MFGKLGKIFQPSEGRRASPFNQTGPLSQSTDEVGCRGLRRRPYKEMQNPRESQWNIEALRDSEARFRAIFENAAVGIDRVAVNRQIVC